MDILPGDIYWVTISPSQVVGSEQHSRRPFVIVSRLLLNRKSNVVVGLPLTRTGSDKTTHPPHRIFIPAPEIIRDVSFTGDIVDSIAMTDQVRVLDKKRLEKKMGVVSHTALTAIGLGLAFLFDIR